MYKYLIMGLLSFFFSKKQLDAQIKSIYDFKVKALDGSTIDFSTFKGKKILIVNTASKCGLTPQYEELQKLHEQFKDLIIVGFPANDFLFQEPGNNKDIQTFCSKNYGVTFLMAEKISVKGKRIHPLYVFLTQKKYNGLSDEAIKWNFQKYLFDENGKLINVFMPKILPLSEEVIQAIKN